MEDSVFILKDLAILPTPTFVMGVDTYDPKNLAYCLTKHTDGDFIEVVLSKRMSDKEAFDEEVDNLCKYFDAQLLK